MATHIKLMKLIYFPFQIKFERAVFISLTLIALSFNKFSSELLNLISIIDSTPLAPIMHGTPIHISSKLYSPSKNTEHGIIFL